MKKVWYLDGKESKKKKTVKLFVYEKEKVPTAHLDLSAFAELAQYDDWIIRFFHKDTSVLKEILYKKDSAFLKEALAGKGILDADTAALLQRNRKDLELCIRAGKFCFVSGGVGCPLHEFDQREEKTENQDTDRNSGQADEQKQTVEPEKLAGQQNTKDPERAIEWQSSREPERQAEQQDGIELERTTERQNSTESERLAQQYEVREAEELQSGFRKIIELGVLEEEMLFRSYLHNSFLLHGYYNYGHLVLDERNGESRLGVPGNYYEREQMVAAMFGFPDFEPAGKEKIQTGTFGYYFTKG